MADENEKTPSNAKMIWLAVAAAVIVLGAAGAWFTLGRSGTAHSAVGSAQSASAQAAPGGACGTALARVRDYGVVPYNSTLSGDADGEKGENGRIACAAASDGKTYSMLVDLSCDDMSNPKCLEIYRVTQGDGNALFQKRPYSF